MAVIQILSLVLAAAMPLGHSVQAQTASDTLPVETIMANVAVNQDRSEAARKQYRSDERIHVITSKPGGNVMRDETAEYEILPAETGAQVRLRSISGRYWHKGKYEDFTGEPVPEPNSWDGDYIRDVRACLAGEKSRCGPAPMLFPLTGEQQQQYEFRLVRRETLRGRDVYHVGFAPKDRKSFGWTGEALIDAIDFQPVRVFTNMSQTVPFMMRSALGTEMSGFGYNIEYTRQADGNWLPASYGMEYRFRLFFHINRTVGVTMDMTFDRVQSSPTNAAPAAPNGKPN